MHPRIQFSFVLFFVVLIGISTVSGQDKGDPGTPQILTCSSARQRADAGDAVAQYTVGKCYMRGSEVPRDDREAAKWFVAAAAQGLSAAQFTLGYQYEQGIGVARDYDRAAQYYRAAAERGHATAA